MGQGTLGKQNTTLVDAKSLSTSYRDSGFAMEDRQKSVLD